MILSVVYLLARSLLGCLMVLGRREVSKDAELLVLRHENAVLDRTLIWNQNHLRRILREYETHHNQHRPHRSRHAAAPLKPLPEPVDLDQYRVRKQARVGGLLNEYHLVASRGQGFRHAQVQLPVAGHRDVQPAPPVLPAGASPGSTVLPEMVRLPPAVRVISTRRAWVFGEAGMVTCRTPSA